MGLFLIFFFVTVKVPVCLCDDKHSSPLALSLIASEEDIEFEREGTLYLYGGYGRRLKIWSFYVCHDRMRAVKKWS